MRKPRWLFQARAGEDAMPQPIVREAPSRPAADVAVPLSRWAAHGLSTPTPRFSEAALQAQIEGLIAQKQTARAVRTLVDALPQLHDANFNVKEKLSNLLFLARRIQDGGGAKYGHAKLRSKVRSLTGFVRNLDLPRGGFIELGCGAHDPVSMSVFFYLNGFDPACGIDLLAPRVERFSAVSMYDILAHIKMFPERYCWRGTQTRDLLARLDTIAVDRFESGDFRGGLDSLGGRVRLLSEDLLKCDIAPGSVALLTSFAVLEHVTQIREILDRCYELLAPGGICYHFIDLADHRSYRGDGRFGPLSFLMEREAPPNMNRLRAPQFTAEALAAGFELLEDRRIAFDMTPDDIAGLMPPFSDMAPEAVAVIKQHLILRKPS